MNENQMDELQQALQNGELTTEEVNNFFKNYADIEFISLEDDIALQVFYTLNISFIENIILTGKG